MFTEPGESHSGDRAVTPVAASRLVLSLFPGAGLLDRGFRLAGFTVVRGPDTLLGESIEDFTFIPGMVTGVFGGPPCQDFSRARRHPPTGHGLKMLGQFCRLVTEAAPDWWLIENVPQVPDVHIPGFTTQRFNVFASECGVRQKRNRSFQFGSRDGVPLTIERGIQSHSILPAVMARDHRRNFADLCELQGLPRTFDLPGLSRSAKYQAVGNGVPVPMAFAVAVAIRERHAVTFRLCQCGCGRRITDNPRCVTATPACRKRMERRRTGHTPGTFTAPVHGTGPLTA